jgi:uncharacterized protein with PQ loop repeat
VIRVPCFTLSVSNCDHLASFCFAKPPTGVLDIFVFLGNGPPLILSLYLNMGAIQLQYAKSITNNVQSIDEGNVEMELSFGDAPLHQPLVTSEYANEVSSTTNLRDDGIPNATVGILTTRKALPVMVPQMYPLLGVLSFWLMFFAAVAYSTPSHEHLTTMVGIASNVILIFFFGAPLSTITTVVQQRSAHSIHKRTMIMTVFNCFFWMAYGFAVNDPYIYTPNVVGLLLGLFQVGFCLCFPSKVAASPSSPSPQVKHDY